LISATSDVKALSGKKLRLSLAPDAACGKRTELQKAPAEVQLRPRLRPGKAPNETSTFALTRALDLNVSRTIIATKPV